MEIAFFLDPKFSRKTNKGEPNFNWAVEEYFEEINAGNLKETNDAYVKNYNERICPFVKPNIPIDAYDEDTVADLIEAVFYQSGYSEVSFESRLDHLICDVVRMHCLKTGLDDPTLRYDFKYSEDIGKEVALARVQKSFSDKEASLFAKALLTNPESLPGQEFGLIACDYAGARNNEAAGLSFRDFYPMKSYPNEYVLRLGALTTNKNRNTLKVSGKTYNAPRIVPVLDVVAEAILKRIKYLESVLTFPIENEDGIFTSVYDLPFACRGNKYTKRCSSNDLSVAANELFLNKLGFTQNRLAGIAELMYRDPERFVEEKSATCYTCRRDFATELSIAFFSRKDSMSYIQYIMGHKIEDSSIKRNDFTDEDYLHEIKEVLEASHRINQFMKTKE